MTQVPPAPASRPWNLQGAEVAFEGGRRALRAGFFEPARSIFQALQPREPEHPEVLVALACTELESGHPALAEALLEALSPADRRHPAVQVLRAECALQQGQMGKGLSRGFACVESHPQNSQGRFLSARLLWLGGQEKACEVEFLHLAGDPGVGARACAWAVLCAWRQGHQENVADLLANLRIDDVVCEGLREFASIALDIPWQTSLLVEPGARSACADTWNRLFHRQFAAPRTLSPFGGVRVLV